MTLQNEINAVEHAIQQAEYAETGGLLTARSCAKIRAAVRQLREVLAAERARLKRLTRK